MASRLLFERRRFPGHVFGGVEVTLVSLAPKPRESCDRSPWRAFVESLSLSQCQTIDRIVECELAKRGYRRARVGGRIYCNVEATVVRNIIERQIDLGEIAMEFEFAQGDWK